MRRAALLQFAAIVLAFGAPALRASEGLSVTPEDKAFFLELKKAVLAHDTAWVAAHVAFPLHVHIDGQAVSIRTNAELIENYDRLVTVALVNTVRKQTAEYLFKNSRGVMIGDGEIWFTRETDDAEADKGKPRFTIIAIGAVAPPREQPAGKSGSGG